MRSYQVILIAVLFLQAVKAIGEQTIDDKIGCQINNNMEFLSGLTGSVYYYPWYSYDTQSETGVQNTDLYTNVTYLSRLCFFLNQL